MRVNTSKICISDSLNTKSGAYILDRDSLRIQSGPKLKVLGWHFPERPTPDAQIGVLKKRFRERYWVLCHLKHNRFGEEDLVKVYLSMIRPVADYMSEVYHSMMKPWNAYKHMHSGAFLAPRSQGDGCKRWPLSRPSRRGESFIAVIASHPGFPSTTDPAGQPGKRTSSWRNMHDVIDYLIFFRYLPSVLSQYFMFSSVIRSSY